MHDRTLCLNMCVCVCPYVCLFHMLISVCFRPLLGTPTWFIHMYSRIMTSHASGWCSQDKIKHYIQMRACIIHTGKVKHAAHFLISFSIPFAVDQQFPASRFLSGPSTLTHSNGSRLQLVLIILIREHGAFGR